MEWLVEHERAGLFMGMGLGKTGSAIMAWLTLHALGESQAALVVAPLRVCNLTWPNELRKWKQFQTIQFANLRTKEGMARFNRRDAHLYLTNWEMLPALARWYEENGEAWPFDSVIFDELTRAKNHKSKRVVMFRKTLSKINRRWGLTGTPNPNSLLELFGQVLLLDDGQRFGPSFSDFQNNLFTAVDYHKRYDWRPDPGTPEIIAAKLATLSITLLSSEFLKNVPDLCEEDWEVDLPEIAHENYKKLEVDLLLSMGDRGDIVAPNAAVLVNKLLQVCSGAAYNEEGDPIELHDAKIKAVKQFVKENHEPTVIVYNYRHELERLRAAFPNALAFEDYKTVERQKELETWWNEKKVSILLVHPKAFSHGLNFQDGGNIVAWFSLTWSREDYDQVNARLYRRGQKKIVRVVRFNCPGKMDDAAIETLSNKNEGQKALVSLLTNYRQLLTG